MRALPCARGVLRTGESLSGVAAKGSIEPALQGFQGPTPIGHHHWNSYPQALLVAVEERKEKQEEDQPGQALLWPSTLHIAHVDDLLQVIHASNGVN